MSRLLCCTHMGSVYEKNGQICCIHDAGTKGTIVPGSLASMTAFKNNVDSVCEAWYLDIET